MEYCLRIFQLGVGNVLKIEVKWWTFRANRLFDFYLTFVWRKYWEEIFYAQSKYLLIFNLYWYEKTKQLQNTEIEPIVSDSYSNINLRQFFPKQENVYLKD